MGSKPAQRTSFSQTAPALAAMVSRLALLEAATTTPSKMSPSPTPSWPTRPMACESRPSPAQLVRSTRSTIRTSPYPTSRTTASSSSRTTRMAGRRASRRQECLLPVFLWTGCMGLWMRTHKVSMCYVEMEAVPVGRGKALILLGGRRGAALILLLGLLVNKCHCPRTLDVGTQEGFNLEFPSVEVDTYRYSAIHLPDVHHKRQFQKHIARASCNIRTHVSVSLLMPNQTKANPERRCNDPEGSNQTIIN